MKLEKLLVPAVLVVGGYLFYKKVAGDVSAAAGAPGQFISDVEKYFSNLVTNTVSGVAPTAAAIAAMPAGLTGANYSVGQGNIAGNTAFSNAFNTIVTGGVQTTAPTAIAIVLNPNMNTAQRQAVQNSLTSATLSGVPGSPTAIASKINWGQTQNIGGSTFPVAGGVITNYSGISPSTPTANLASLFATGRIS